MSIPYEIVYQKGYLDGVKQLGKKHQYNILQKLKDIVNKLQKKEIITQYHNHPLTNIGKDIFELHIDGDVLLVYQYVDNKLILNLITILNHKDLKNTEQTKQIRKQLLNSLSLEKQFNNKIVEDIGKQIKSDCRLIESSLTKDYFTKEEIKTLPNEIEHYFQDLDIPKYYDISINEVEDGKYDIRGNIDYGDLKHDHKYFDEQVTKFFNDKGIKIIINEPKELQSKKDEDNIYSSVHIINKVKE